jgi:hypothetical protein
VSAVPGLAQWLRIGSRIKGIMRRPSKLVLQSAVLILVFVGCSSGPPPDFAPDPSLVSRIAEIRMHISGGPVCPGYTIRSAYDAVLDDGSVIPFSTRYDDDNPPALHVIFLRRTSAQATPRGDGGWDTNPDPVISAVTGFRLMVTLVARPSLIAEGAVAPEYSCMRQAFSFRGPRGKVGQSGGPGPDVTVRLNVLSSPFHDSLFVAGVEVGQAPPFYVFAQADVVPPLDWITIESRGGDGGRGADGAAGEPGAKGTDGCPAGAGGAGGRGGNGGPGGPGGPGGRITIVVPVEQPLLAGLVDAYSSGGNGGAGGERGEGGAGGEGGTGVAQNRRCANGRPGPAGAEGVAGQQGAEGSPGFRAQVFTVPSARVFEDPRLVALLEYGGER